MKYCLALADWVTEGRCNHCWGDVLGGKGGLLHRLCKSQNLRESQPLPLNALAWPRSWREETGSEQRQKVQ